MLGQVRMPGYQDHITMPVCEYLIAVQNNIWVEDWEQGYTKGYVHIDASVLTAASASLKHFTKCELNK